MAFQLNQYRDTDYVLLTSDISFGAAAWSVEFVYLGVSSGIGHPLGRDGNSRHRLRIDVAANTISLTDASNSTISFTLPASYGADVSAGTFITWRIVKDSNSDYEIFYDGVSLGASQNLAGSFQFNSIFKAGTTVSQPSKLRRMTFYDENDTVIHNYDPSASSGSGLMLLDTVGGNNGVLTNFPADDVHWEFYQSFEIDFTEIRPSDTVMWVSPLSGLTGAYLEDSNNNRYNLTNVTDTGGTLPALVGGLAACLFGQVTLNITDGTDIESLTITLLPPLGYELVTLTSVPVTTIVTDWVFGLDTPAIIGDQGLFLLSSLYTYNPDGTTNNVSAGSETYYTVLGSSGGVSEITKTFEGVVSNLVADAGIDQSSDEGDIVTLDGTGSQNAITYLWEQISGTTVTINNASSDTATFTAPASTEDLIFRLTVGDGQTTESDNTTVSNTAAPANNPPVADAGANQSVNSGDIVTLDGSGTIDPDSDPLTYSWSQLTGTTVQLSDSTAVQPTFTAPSAFSEQNLIFELTADDGQDTDSDQVTITIAADTPPPPTEGGSSGGIFVDVFEC